MDGQAVDDHVHTYDSFHLYRLLADGVGPAEGVRVEAADHTSIVHMDDEDVVVDDVGA